jgi:hypothetical protein
MFNILNHPNFGPPANTFGASGFGISNQILGKASTAITWAAALLVRCTKSGVRAQSSLLLSLYFERFVVEAGYGTLYGTPGKISLKTTGK